ncbi:hypothetical protein [Mycolicibacterium aubagnense]|nr:hypothetical protein [Mycolicibacterium aubagnense]WGI35221.1 hypothetical protein QDT91_13255 [Mycolicibacterium aubagnense]
MSTTATSLDAPVSPRGLWGATGERTQWWWYQPFQPPPTPSTN